MNSRQRKILVQKIGIIGSLLCSIVVAIIWMVNTGVIKFNYPNKVGFPVQGIDISHHQGDIDWEQVSPDEVRFIIMKATEGGDHKDKKYNEYWKEAISKGIKVGAYHYFSFCKSGEIQAENFIASVPVLDAALPPTIDLEYDKNCNGDVPVRELQKELVSFVNAVKRRYHKNPILYCTKEFYNKYLQITELEDCYFWVRDLYAQPKLDNNTPWHFWQHSSKGTVSGIKGFVDLNVFNGSILEMQEM